MTKKYTKSTRFPETRWSLINRAKTSDELIRQQAMAELLIIYLPALKAFLVKTRRLPEDLADDLLHDFVVDKVLTRKLVRYADQKKGKFRSYLLKALNNFVTTRLKKEYRTRAITFDIDELTFIDPASLRNTSQFDAEWVQQLVRNALCLMEADCKEKGRIDLWEIFYLRIVEPMLNDVEPVNYEQIARRFDIQTPRQAINLLVTAKRCFTRHLRSAVGRYVNGEDKIDQEISDLREIVWR